MLCRPELAPGRARVDATGRLASAVVRMIEDGALAEARLTNLAAELGVTDRHLRRAVQEHYGVSPVELAQTQRLLSAKRMLTDTDLPIGEIAFASGFASLRRLNASFKERYRMSPSDLRKRRKRTLTDVIKCEIAYRPPYDWRSLLSFLSDRAVTGVEVVQDGRYSLSVRIGEHRGWISVSPIRGRNALRLDISASLGPVLPSVTRRAKRLFDTAAEPQVIADCLGSLCSNPGVRVPGAFDGFEVAVRAILGQQVTVKGARTLAGRLVAAFGESIQSPVEGLTHTFPTPEVLASCEIGDIASLGIVGARSKSIQCIAQAVAAGELKLLPGVDVETALDKLRSLPGVGEWTAQYIAMRALSYPDAFPASDLGVLKALRTSKEREALDESEKWKPWRAYATMHLWRGLESGD